MVLVSGKACVRDIRTVRPQTVVQISNLQTKTMDDDGDLDEAGLSEEVAMGGDDAEKRKRRQERHRTLERKRREKTQGLLNAIQVLSDPHSSSSAVFGHLGFMLSVVLTMKVLEILSRSRKATLRGCRLSKECELGLVKSSFALESVLVVAYINRGFVWRHCRWYKTRQ